MMKILHCAKEIDGWTVKYYLTVETRNNLPYYGVLITSGHGKTFYSAAMTDVFPYEPDATVFLAYLSEHDVTPVSAKDIMCDYMEAKIVNT